MAHPAKGKPFFRPLEPGMGVAEPAGSGGNGEPDEFPGGHGAGMYRPSFAGERSDYFDDFGAGFQDEAYRPGRRPLPGKSISGRY
jgi:hypothetical protein